MKLLALFVLGLLFLTGCVLQPAFDINTLSQEERRAWFENATVSQKKDQLNPQQFHSIVDGKMEGAFTGKYAYLKAEGEFYSAICGYHVFSSRHRFDDRSGWLDFTKINESSIAYREDSRDGYKQVYTLCGEYLGYLMPDEGIPGGDHFVINSASLQFRN